MLKENDLSVKTILAELKNLLNEERKLLLSFPPKNVSRLEEIQEEKKKLLLELSSFNTEEVKKERELLSEIQKLNTSIAALISNGISFFEEIEKELFGQNVTYDERNRKHNLFNKKA